MWQGPGQFSPYETCRIAASIAWIRRADREPAKPVSTIATVTRGFTGAHVWDPVSLVEISTKSPGNFNAPTKRS
jgi:hypothetical protein